MPENYYASMLELLGSIRTGTINACRCEFDKHQQRQALRPNPWVAMREIVSDDPASNAKPSDGGKSEGLGSFMFKNVSARLVDSLAEDSQKKDFAVLRSVLDKHLDEARMAAMLFTVSTDQLGLPWGGVDCTFPVQESSFCPRIGSLTFVPDDLALALPGLDWTFVLPAVISLGEGRAVLVSSPPSMRDKATESLHSVALRLLLAAPPGLVKVTIFAPGGLDSEKTPWAQWPDTVYSDSMQIEKKLDEMVDRMETVAKEKLCGEIRCLQDYNARARAKSMPCESYNVLLLLDCPAGFSSTMVRKLQLLAKNSGCCGNVVLIHWNDSGEVHTRKELATWASGSVLISWDEEKKQFVWRDDAVTDCSLSLDELPPPEKMNHIIGAAFDGWQRRIEAEAQYAEHQKAGAIGYVHSILLHCLASFPPGRMLMTFVDPVASGNNMAPFLSLGAIDKSLISERAWTDASDIERQIAALKNNLEDIIHNRLHKTGAANALEHNNKVELIETIPYRFLVIFDFPTNLTANSLASLRTLAMNGLQCGIYVIIVRDKTSVLPLDIKMAELQRADTIINLPALANSSVPATPFGVNWESIPLCMPPPEVTRAVLERIGASLKSEKQTALSFDSIIRKAGLGDEANWWKAHTTTGFDGLLGLELSGSGPQWCRFDNVSPHGIMAGISGTGKSNALDVLITSLALRYSPDELEFFLVDLKDGVGFQHFAVNKLPHARVVSITPDRDFAISVLRSLDDEMSRRARLFTENNARDIEAYRNITGKCLSRILLVIDEVKTIYAEQDDDGLFALSFFDKIAAKGRSFGLHLLLANQTFIGATLKASTLANLGIRIVTKKDGSDTAENVLEARNDVLKTLSMRQAVYNDQQGGKDFNHPCRIPLWQDVDELLIQRLAKKTAPEFRAPIIFDGRANVAVSECSAFGETLPPAEPRMWIGLPMSLEPHVQVEWRCESRNNLLIVEQNEEKAVGLMVAALMGLLASTSSLPRQFRFVDCGTTGKAWSNSLGQIHAAFPDRTAMVSKARLADEVRSLARMVEDRNADNQSNQAPLFLAIHGIHRLRNLDERRDSPAGPAPINAAKSTSEALASIMAKAHGNVAPASQSKPGSFATSSIRDMLAFILKDGAYVGVHVLTWCDTAGNARKLLAAGRLKEEFGMVAVGPQADKSDSLELIGNGKAAGIAETRMIFFNAGAGGKSFTFRPYTLPSDEWFQQMAAKWHMAGT